MSSSENTPSRRRACRARGEGLPECHSTIRTAQAQSASPGAPDEVADSLMQAGLLGLFPLILAATLSALGLAPILIRGAAQLGLVDVPGSAPHKRHTRGSPLAGGRRLARSSG